MFCSCTGASGGVNNVDSSTDLATHVSAARIRSQTTQEDSSASANEEALTVPVADALVPTETEAAVFDLGILADFEGSMEVSQGNRGARKRTSKGTQRSAKKIAHFLLFHNNNKHVYVVTIQLELCFFILRALLLRNLVSLDVQ